MAEGRRARKSARNERRKNQKNKDDARHAEKKANRIMMQKKAK